MARELAVAGAPELAQWINITLATGGPQAASELRDGLPEKLKQFPHLPSALVHKVRAIAAMAMVDAA